MGNSSSSSKKNKKYEIQKSSNSNKIPIRPIYPLTVSSNSGYRNTPNVSSANSTSSGARRPKKMCQRGYGYTGVSSSNTGYSTYVNSGEDYNSCSTYDFGGSSYSGGSSGNVCGGGSSGGGD